MNSGYNSGNQGPFMESTWNNTPVSQSSAEVQIGFIRKTYLFFMAGILSAIMGGVLCLNVEPILRFALAILDRPLIALVVILGGSFAAQALAYTPGVNYAALFGFTSLIGIVFTPIIAMYAPAVVGQAAFLTLIVFGSLTAYTFVTRKDFSFMGGILFVGILTVVLAGAANLLFFKSSGASYWLAWATLFVSSGFVLYQTSNIIHHHTERDTVAAALGLFISFFNIFMSLLRILGGNRN